MKLKAVSGIMLTLLLIGMFPGSLMITDVQSHALGIVLSAFATKTPMIDGVIDFNEWQDAAVLSTTISGYEITFFAMSDLTNLYLAVRVSDFRKDPNDDRLFLQFDNDHDNILEDGDDQIVINARTRAFYDCFFYNHSGFCGFAGDVDFGGTTDGLGDTLSTNGFREYEISHPLNSSDDLHDFSLNFGDTVGFTLEIWDCFETGEGQSIEWPASVMNWAFTGPLGDITIATPPTPALPVGGKATPINIPIDKPKTPTLWIWLTTIILPLVATVVFMKLKKKKQ